MAHQVIESVINFSQGRCGTTIERIAQAIVSTPGASLLAVDPGYGANRTVYTFIGSPQAVCQAAFEAIKCATELIDMRQHTGSHPRIGAADVVPLIPIEGISLAQVAHLAHELSQRLASELGLAVYCYEAAATAPHRANLAMCRMGEYEGIENKLSDALWKPDYGACEFSLTHQKSGISVVGARDYLVAVNFNLPTSDVQLAKRIAAKLRHSGSVVNGKREHGLLKGVKAIGWYIDEYGFAQVSVNITDINIAPLWLVYHTVCSLAAMHRTSVTGTEIIGLIPRSVALSAAKGMGIVASDDYSAIEQLADKMGMHQIAPFLVEERIIEYVKPIKEYYYGRESIRDSKE